jgi:hypothetical protein
MGCIQIFVRSILAEKAVKIAPVKKDGHVYFSVMGRPLTEPGSTAVGRKRVSIGVKNSAVFR